MADFVDDLNLVSGKPSDGFVDDLDLVEKPKPSFWERAKSAIGLDAQKMEITVDPSAVPKPEPARGPMTAAVKLIQGVRDQRSEPLLLTKDATGTAFVRTMSRVPENLLASGIKAVQGKSGASVVDQDLGDRLVSWVEERNKQLAQEYSNEGIISRRDVAELGPNLGFSGISMTAGIGGGIGGGLAGSFAPGPGNVVGSVSGSMAASGAAAYRMQTYSAMMDWLTKVNEESIKQTGKPITPAEEKKFKEHFDKLASESGLWEAGPEAVGNVLEIALMAGKGTLPGRLASLLPKGTAGKVVKGVARAAGIVGTEESTETITQHGQHNVEVKAGMSKEPIREWTSGDDLLKSAGDVLPGVLLLSGFMTGGGAIYRKAAGKNKTKQLSSPEELSKPDEVKAEEQPFVDDINISEEEVNPNSTAEGKKPEGDIGEHSGTDRVGEAAGSGGSDITEPSGEVKEAPKVEPRRIIDDILKDLDEVQGQQAEFEKAKDAGIAVSPEKEVAVEQKADDLKAELVETVKEESQQPKDVKPIVKEALQKPTPIPTKEAIATKAQTKQTLEAGLKTGDIAADTPVRLTSVDELRSIIKNGRLFVGKDAEGHDVISAQKIKQDVPIVGYGANNKISAAIIFESSHIEGNGMAPNEVSIHPKTEVSKLRFVVDGHDKILTFDEIKEIYKGGQEQNPSEETKEVVPAKLPVELSKSNPRYSYREKQFQIEFPDDVTKAAYIVRNSKKLSAKDAGFMSFLRSQYPEKTDEQIRALGESIKSDLTTQAKTAKHNTTLKVNSIIQEKENVDPAGQSDKIETDEVDFYDRPDSKKILDEAGTEGHEAADIAASLREGEEIGDSEGAILSPREVEAKVEKLAEPATIPDVTTPKGTGNITAKDNPTPEAVYHGGSGIDSLNKKFSILSPEEKQKLPSSNVGLTGLSMTTDKGTALEYSRNIGGTDKIFEAKINPSAKIYEVDTKGVGIDDFLTDNQINEIKNNGYDAIRDISKEGEKEFRALTEKAVIPAKTTPQAEAVDKAYLDAVKNNDITGIKKSLNDAAKEAGLLGPFYHGSRNKSGGNYAAKHNPKEFDHYILSDSNTQSQGLYLSPNESIAKGYVENNGELRAFFVKSKNPFNGDIHDFYKPIADGALKKFNKRTKNKYSSWEEVFDENDHFEIEEKIREKIGDFDYDGRGSTESRAILFVYGDKGAVNPSWRTYDLIERGYDAQNDLSSVVDDKQFIVFKPSQLVSAENIIYDSDGNIIPLSKRFQLPNPSRPPEVGGQSVKSPISETKPSLPKPPEDSISGKVEAAGAILEQKYPESQIGLRDGKYQIISPDKFTNLKDAPAEDIRLAQVALGDIKENVLKAQNIIFGSNKKGNIKISDSELKALDDVIKSEESEINHVLKRFGLSIGDLIKNPNILEDAITQKPVPKKAEGKATAKTHTPGIAVADADAVPKPTTIKGFVGEHTHNGVGFIIQKVKHGYRAYNYDKNPIMTKEFKTAQEAITEAQRAIDAQATPKPAPKVEAATKVIPTTKTAEKNVTTPKEQKAYVLDKVDDLVIKARKRWKEQIDDRLSDKEIDEAVSRGKYGSETAEESVVVIEVPNDGRYKVPNTLRNLLLFKKQFKAMSTNTAPPDIKPPMPSKKPTGKPIEQIEKEAAEEHQRYLDDRDNAKIEYEAAFKRLEGERKALNDWKEVERKIDDREIKPDIKRGREQYDIKGWGVFSPDEIGVKIRELRAAVTEAEKLVNVAKNTIRQSYPSLYKEMFEKTSGMSKQATPKTETQQPRTWFELGRIVSDKYSNLARGKSTSLKPDDVTLKQVSSEIGITNEDARRALTVYNSSEPREREKNISKPVPKIADTDKSNQKPEAKEPWQMTREEFNKIVSAGDVGAFAESFQVNYDTNRRGQGKRVGGMVKGAMSERLGVKSYTDFAAKLSSAERADVEVLKTLEQMNYAKARSAGLDHETAMLNAYEGIDGHKKIVEKAISEGKPVPPEVLKDYPELNGTEQSDNPIVQKLTEIKDKLSTITSRDEAAEIDKSISREIYDEIKRYDSALAYNLMKKAEAGLPAALSLNKGIKDGKTTLHQMDVKDLNEVLDRAINLLSNDKGPQIVKTESQKIEDQGGTDDSGVELAYNKRNRIRAGIKWTDIQDKNTALKVKEVTKSNVYPKPDYQQMVADGMHPMSAYLVKTVYDSIPPTPVIGSRTITDEDMQRYITAVNRVMDGVTVWANDKEAIKAWASKQASVAGAMLGRVTSITDLAKADKSLLGMIYPDGYKNHMEEVRILGGRSIIQGLQPGYKQGEKAIKEIEKGWPGKIESWQRQGYAVIERKDIKVPAGWTDSNGKPVYMTEINGRTFGERYGNREDAQAAIDKMQPFILVDKYSRPVSQHDTREAAEETAKEKVKRDGGKTINEKGISVESAERIGEPRRKEGENITSDRLRETFGFKGVNFGNWMKGNANEAERQLHLNHAYDSFMDLAELLNVPPEALSLNGMLGVAIGAQGSGAAAAHFVPGVNEINLTRTAGAGAIAHEWAHALDHYFGTQAGLSAAKHPYLTENKPIGENIRPEIVSLFNKIVHTMNHKTLTITPEEQTRQDETRKQQAKGNVESWLKSIRGDYINNGIDEQAFDAIANRIRNMELGDGRVSVSGYFSMSPAVSELRNLYKEKTGRTYSLDQIKGLQTNIDHYKYLSEKDQTDHVPQTRETYSDYALEAGRLDKGKKKDYWNTNREKFARAFDAFITDSISEKEAKNTYLSGIEAAPPKGEERKTINQAFRELVDEIKTRETENGLMLFDNKGNYDIIKAKKAGLVDDETIQRIENYGNEISTSKRGNLDSTVRASKIPADFTKQGFVDLRGQRIESPRDLAAICQIFRDPQVETLRYFYLKDGVIVGHEGISSRMPGFASFFPTGQFAKNIMKMIGRARRLKADEIYMLHNHPSGVPKPSDEDMRATATLSGNLYLKSKEDGRGTIKLSTHVIIDHKKYGVITPKLSFGKKGNIEGISVNRYISDLPEGKEYGPPSVPHELLGAKIADQDDLVNIGKLVKSPKNYATLIFRDGNGKVSGIQDVHVGMLKGKDADGYLRARARDFGAQNIFAHVLDIEEIGESRVRELIKNGSLLDVSWGNKAASESGMRKRLGYVFGKKISDYGSMRVHEWSNVENLTENQREARKRIERNLSIMGDEAQKAGVSIEDYMKATGMSEGQVTRLMEYAKAQPVEAPEGYREVLPDEVLPAGSDVNMDFISGKSFVKVKDTTGVKHAAIEEERVKAGKEPVIKQEPRGNEGMFQAAKAAVDSGEIKPRLLAQEVAKKPRPITTEEEFALMYDRMRIKNELRDIQRQIDTAQQDKNSQMEADLLERRTAIESDLDTNDQATTHGGSEVGRSLQARTRMINEDYSLEEILLRARQDNGGTLSEEMRKKYEALAREIEEANEKIKAYEEKIASLEAKRSFQRMKNDDVIIRHLGQAKEKRASAKKALDDEFSQLTKQLNAALGGIHMNFDPTAVKILALMAKNRIKAGILTPDGIVNEIYEQVHESYPEVEKRDIRDAISGYGRTLQLSKDEIDVQLREAKRLMRLISSYEDASSGQVPLRSGMQRDKMTNEVRELGRRVRQAMREAGIDWESSLSPEEQWKTSLDAVKTRLRNQIHDIKQQIETGEKSPKKIGIKYDEEAEALRAQRDKLKDILISIEGKPGMSPEQKINLAMAAVEKSIAEYERRISEKDLAPKKQGTGSPETPELKSLRDRRDELRAIYKEMQKEAKPKKTPEEIALQSYKTRMKNRIKELEEKLEKKDFAEKPKRELRLDDEGLTLKHNLDRAISRLNEARLKDQLARRNWLQKFIGGTAETANFMRSVKASMDVSAVFRQGLFTVVSHPVVGAKALPAMFKAFKNDKYRFAVEQDILNRPNYKLYKDAGLDLTDIGTDLSKMEETFMSRLAEKIPGVAGSQRAYTTFLNKIRVDTFDLLIKNLVKSEGKHTPEEAKAIATLINESTGRGKVGMKPNTLSGLNTIFFAPRLVASRFQILAGHSMWKGTKASRKLIAKEYGRFLAGMSVVYLLAQLAGFDIEWDPRSSDFGKIKIGNTRIDPMGGFAQVIVFSSRVISGKTKSSSGVIKPIRGDVQYGQGNTADVIWRFLRTKLAPAVSVSIDALTGTDVVGNKVTVFNPDELKAPETVTDIPKQMGKVSSLPEKTVAPMAIVDTYEAMRDRGIPQGLAIGALGMLGVGIQTYEKDTKQKLKDDLRDAIKSEDQEAIDTAKEAISDASDNELITERDKKRILKDAKDDAFVSAAKKMPLPALAEMIKEDATDDQKEALHDIFKKKIDRARQERRIDSETQDRYYEILEEMR